MYDVTIPSLYRVFRLSDTGPLSHPGVPERVNQALRHNTILDTRKPIRSDLCNIPPLPSLHTVFIGHLRLIQLSALPPHRRNLSSRAKTVILDTYLFFETAMTPFLLSGRPPMDRISRIFPLVDTLILRLSPIHLSRSLRSPLLLDLDPAIRAVVIVLEPDRNAKYWMTMTGDYKQEEKPYIISDTLATFMLETTATVTIVGLEGVHPLLRPDHQEPLAQSTDIIAVFDRRMTEVIEAVTLRARQVDAKVPLDGQLDGVQTGRGVGCRLMSMQEFAENGLHADEVEMMRLEGWLP